MRKEKVASAASSDPLGGDMDIQRIGPMKMGDLACMVTGKHTYQEAMHELANRALEKHGGMENLRSIAMESRPDDQASDAEILHAFAIEEAIEAAETFDKSSLN